MDYYTVYNYFEDLFNTRFFGNVFNNAVLEFKRANSLTRPDAHIAWELLIPIEIDEFMLRYERFIRPHSMEKINCSTVPIIKHFKSKRNRNLVLHEYPSVDIDYKECIDIWNIDAHDCENYGNISTHGTKLHSRLFKNGLLIRTVYFKNTMSVLMYEVNKKLINIYNMYPTFKDYNNLAAHVVFIGMEYYHTVLNNPNIIIDTLISEDYVKLWDVYLKATRL